MDQQSLSILAILFDNSSPPQGLYRLNREADPCATDMAHPGLVSPIIGYVDRKSSSAFKTKGYSQRSFRMHLLMKRPGESGLAVLLESKLTHIIVL